jgi:hypothetical protein
MVSHLWLVICYLLLVIGYWLLVIGYWLFDCQSFLGNNSIDGTISESVDRASKHSRFPASEVRPY